MTDDLVERLRCTPSALAAEAAAEIARLRARPTWAQGVEAAAVWHDEEARQSINLREDYLADYHTNCAANLRALKEPEQ